MPEIVTFEKPDVTVASLPRTSDTTTLPCPAQLRSAANRRDESLTGLETCGSYDKAPARGVEPRIRATGDPAQARSVPFVIRQRFKQLDQTWWAWWAWWVSVSSTNRQTDLLVSFEACWIWPVVKSAGVVYEDRDPVVTGVRR